MTPQEFDALPRKRQLAVLRELGRFLGVRWEEQVAVTLYQLPGWLFVEQLYDTAADHIVDLHSFSASELLDSYPGQGLTPHWLDRREE